MNTLDPLSNGENVTDSLERKINETRATLREGLDAYVVGQDAAKEAIIQTVMSGLFEIGKEQGSMGAIFLAGPTGVGKTELARALARTLLGDPDGLTKLECETMMHDSDISRLVGASPGYIGYGNTPMLADTVLFKPYQDAKEANRLHPIINTFYGRNFSIVLVDEIEKAAPKIATAFLNALQSGKLQMSAGKEQSNRQGENIPYSGVTHFDNTLFIFTSNVGEHTIKNSRRKGIGFTSSQDTSGDTRIFEDELKNRFPPEFLGRMDHVIRCHAITTDTLSDIIRVHLSRYNKILHSQNLPVEVELTDDFIAASVKKIERSDAGARAVSPVLKDVRFRTGILLNAQEEFGEFQGKIIFDYKDGVSMSLIPNTGERQTKKTPEKHIGSIIRDKVEERISEKDDTIRAVALAYLRLISAYHTHFDDATRILKKRLIEYGFTEDDIQMFHDGVHQAWYDDEKDIGSYAVVDRNTPLFGSIGFRPIEKYLRVAIYEKTPLVQIFKTIQSLLGRPITKDEGLMISRHAHNIMVQGQKFHDA